MEHWIRQYPTVMAAVKISLLALLLVAFLADSLAQTCSAANKKVSFVLTNNVGVTIFICKSETIAFKELCGEKL